ncbi:MAG: hypothetical protein ACFFDK_04895 [Promethearchaeota archaeon]
MISDGYNDEWGWNNNLSFNPEIAIDTTGNLHVVWSDSSNGAWKDGSLDSEIMYANYTSAYGWSNATVISDGYNVEWGWNTGSSVDPKISIDKFGNIHVVWSDSSNGAWKDGSLDSEIMYVNYTSAYGWSNATVISDGYNDEWGWNTERSIRPDIAVDNFGNIHVVWYDYTPGVWGGGSSDTEIMYVNYTSANGWSNATVISDGYNSEYWNDGGSSSPSICIDNSTNNIHVVWTDYSNGYWKDGGSDSEIMYVNYTSANGWSNATVISDGYNDEWGWNTEGSFYPDITMDFLGNIHVVWSDYTPGVWGGGSSDSEIMYVNYTSTNGWSNVTVISDGYNNEYWNDGDSSSPSICIDNSINNIHVVWTDVSNGAWKDGSSDSEIMYVNYASANGWSNATVISDGYNNEWGWNNNNSFYPKIAIDVTGNLHVVWTDVSNGAWKDGSSDSEIMYVKFSFNSNGITYPSDNDKSNGKSREEVDYSEIFIISLCIGAAVISALSIYHINKNTNLFNFKHKKKIKISKKTAKSSQRAKKIISGFDNKDLVLLFESEKVPEPLSFLKNIDLTIISDEFLKIVDKLGFENDEKAEFLKEMLYFSEEERNNIIEDILNKIKSDKSTK